MHLYSHPRLLHARHLITLPLIIRMVFGEHTCHRTPRYVVFSTPLPRYVVPLWPKHLPVHPILEHSHPTFLYQCGRQVSHPHKTKLHIFTFNLYIWVYDFLTAPLSKPQKDLIFLVYYDSSTGYLPTFSGVLLTLNDLSKFQ